MQEFFNMGGYAFYVWSAYAAVAVVLIANLIYPWHRRRQLLREIARLASPETTDDAQA